MTKETFYISFYTYAGYALREVMTYKATHATDGRLINAALKKGKKLGADHFHVFKVIPRRFSIPKDED